MGWWKRGNANAVNDSLFLSFLFLSTFVFHLQMKETILVTGGTGLVGHGVQLALERTKGDGKQENENWIFLSSKDCYLL